MNIIPKSKRLRYVRSGEVWVFWEGHRVEWGSKEHSESVDILIRELREGKRAKKRMDALKKRKERERLARKEVAKEQRRLSELARMRMQDIKDPADREYEYQRRQENRANRKLSKWWRQRHKVMGVGVNPLVTAEERGMVRALVAASEGDLSILMGDALSGKLDTMEESDVAVLRKRVERASLIALMALVKDAEAFVDAAVKIAKGKDVTPQQAKIVGDMVEKITSFAKLSSAGDGGGGGSLEAIIKQWTDGTVEKTIKMKR